MSDSNSATSGPGVALLFEDADLGAHLRQALVDAGARIVHEGPATKVTREDLSGNGADVVVVNLDATVEDHLDALYEIFDEDSQRIVFNDAEASSGLSGWDQARWARHLAAKLMDAHDVDPPRPEEARLIEAHPTELLLPDEEMPEAPTAEELPETEAGSSAADDASSEDSEALTAELEALLAEDGDLLGQMDSTAASDAGADLHLDEGDVSDADPDAIGAIPDAVETPVAAPEAPQGATEAEDTEDAETFEIGTEDTDGFEDALRMFDDALAQSEETAAPSFDPSELGRAAEDASGESDDAEHAAETDVATENDFGLQLEDESEAESRDESSSTVAPEAVDSAKPDSAGSPYELVDLDDAAPMDAPATSKPSVEVPSAPDWDLVDFDAPVETAPSGAMAPQESGEVEKVDPSAFGIEKMSASDYLAPESEAGEDSAQTEPTFSLELEPIEQAIAPKMAEISGNEMMLESHGENIRRAVVVAAGNSVEARASLREFLGALRGSPKAVLIGVVHQQAGDDLQALARELDDTTAYVNVRVAEFVSKLRHGEMLLIPAGKQAALERGGRMQLLDTAEQPLSNPSIDLSMTLVAQEMGADAIAVVLAGDAIDALAGAQAINDCGGRVLALDPADCNDNTMVAVICEEQLAQYTGTAGDLAARLLEELS